MSVPLQLVLPGLDGSGPAHWQTRWQARHADLRRVEQANWEAPQCAAWVARLEEAVTAATAERGQPPLLIAHSLGCLLVAHWAALHGSSNEQGGRVRGALLVAVPDAGRADFPARIEGFRPHPEQALPFPSLVLTSTDDPYGSAANAERLARCWGSDFRSLGPLGHINSDSGLGDWDAGWAVYREFVAGLPA